MTSLRLYFNPIDFAPALGVVGRAVGPAALRLARRGLEIINLSAAILMALAMVPYGARLISTRSPAAMTTPKPHITGWGRFQSHI